MSRRRWSDNERNFGPFTFSKDRGAHWTCTIDTNGDDDRPYNRITLRAHRYTMLLWLPPIIPPHRERVHVGNGWDAETIKRLGRDWYINETERSYGFSIFEGLLAVRYGRQSMDSRTEQTWLWSLPWTQWRHVRQSFYGLNGEHLASVFERDQRHLPGIERFRATRAIEDGTPTRVFVFADYDGEVIEATTRIEEREWRFGTGWFSWLSLFRRAKVRRSLDISFSAEVGKRKGSWKGGTVGHSIDMLAGELHEGAFLRYCAEHSLTFMSERGVQ